MNIEGQQVNWESSGSKITAFKVWPQKQMKHLLEKTFSQILPGFMGKVKAYLFNKNYTFSVYEQVTDYPYIYSGFLFQVLT